MLEVVVSTVLKDDRRVGPFLRCRVIEAWDTDGVERAAQFRHFHATIWLDPAGFAEKMMDHLSTELVVGQVVLTLRQASVDVARLKNVGNLYRATGLPAEEADAQAFLFYCFVFGQSLLFLERGPRKRAQLVAKSAEKLLRDQE